MLLRRRKVLCLLILTILSFLLFLSALKYEQDSYEAYSGNFRSVKKGVEKVLFARESGNERGAPLSLDGAVAAVSLPSGSDNHNNNDNGGGESEGRVQRRGEKHEQQQQKETRNPKGAPTPPKTAPKPTLAKSSTATIDVTKAAAKDVQAAVVGKASSADAGNSSNMGGDEGKPFPKQPNQRESLLDVLPDQSKLMEASMREIAARSSRGAEGSGQSAGGESIHSSGSTSSDGSSSSSSSGGKKAVLGRFQAHPQKMMLDRAEQQESDPKDDQNEAQDPQDQLDQSPDEEQQQEAIPKGIRSQSGLFSRTNSKGNRRTGRAGSQSSSSSSSSSSGTSGGSDNNRNSGQSAQAESQQRHDETAAPGKNETKEPKESDSRDPSAPLQTPSAPPTLLHPVEKLLAQMDAEFSRNASSASPSDANSNADDSDNLGSGVGNDASTLESQESVAVPMNIGSSMLARRSQARKKLVASMATGKSNADTDADESKAQVAHPRARIAPQAQKQPEIVGAEQQEQKPSAATNDGQGTLSGTRENTKEAQGAKEATNPLLSLPKQDTVLSPARRGVSEREIEALSIVAENLPLFDLLQLESSLMKPEVPAIDEPTTIPSVDDENTTWFQPKSYAKFSKQSPFPDIHPFLVRETKRERLKPGQSQLAIAESAASNRFYKWLEANPSPVPWSSRSDMITLASSNTRDHQIPFAVCVAGDLEFFGHPFVLRTFLFRLIYSIGGTPVIFLYHQSTANDEKAIQTLIQIAEMVGVTALHVEIVSPDKTASDDWENGCPKFPKQDRADFLALKASQNCMRLVERYERINGYRFHFVVHSLSTLAWLMPIKLLSTFSTEAIHVANSGGKVSELFAVVPRSLCLAYYSLLTSYKECVADYEPESVEGSNSLNQLLQYHLTKHRVLIQKHTNLAIVPWVKKKGLDCATTGVNSVSSTLCKQLKAKAAGL